MNHYIGILVMSVCVATVFTLIARNTLKSRILYFLKLMGYMAIGSLVAAWIMYIIPG